MSRPRWEYWALYGCLVCLFPWLPIVRTTGQDLALGRRWTLAELAAGELMEYSSLQLPINRWEHSRLRVPFAHEALEAAEALLTQQNRVRSSGARRGEATAPRDGLQGAYDRARDIASGAWAKQKLAWQWKLCFGRRRWTRHAVLLASVLTCLAHWAGAPLLLMLVAAGPVRLTATGAVAVAMSVAVQLLRRPPLRHHG
eukprot:TRINITY_DN8627_c0_g1_i1.p3 TRINITY_DN8627_c0_g1~~TRINITY_DN8627_c0_g1_i1.p3  ORF type:complete len:199 (-),score=41.99 TRINITY_DN8627_c0_g1_i1:165-761(-)